MISADTKIRALATAQSALSKIGSAVNNRHACIVLVSMLLMALRRYHNCSEAQALKEAHEYAVGACDAKAEGKAA